MKKETARISSPSFQPPPSALIPAFMHELSIAMSMIEMATEEAGRRGGVSVSAIHLKLGELSGVVKEALLFSYEVACAGTPLEGSQLVIEEVPVLVYCRRVVRKGRLFLFSNSVARCVMPRPQRSCAGGNWKS